MAVILVTRDLVMLGAPPFTILKIGNYVFVGLYRDKVIKLTKDFLRG